MESATRRICSFSEGSTAPSVVESGAAREMLLKMNHFRKNGHFDIRLKVGSQIFPAHKHVLAAFSNYFQSMFIGSGVEACLTELKLEDFKECVFGVLLNYIYCDKIQINQSNLKELLSCANILQAFS